MKIVVADNDVKVRKELNELLSSIGENSITVYSVRNLWDDINDGISDADIYYIGVTGSKDLAVKTADKLKKEMPLSQIIFTFSDSYFCEECYEVDHVYGLFWPFEQKKVLKSLNKAQKLVTEIEEKMFKFSFAGRKYFLNLSEILYFEKDKRKVRVYLRDGNYKEFYATMESILVRLSDKFIRCHNSYVINTMCIKEYDNTGFIMLDDRFIPISRTYAGCVKKVVFESC